MNEEELPIANLASLHANSNRDPKRKSKPYSFKDFMFYSDNESGELPSGRYGSAAIALVRERKFPDWALFCFPQLKSGADPDSVPSILAFIAEDAILLAPIKTQSGWSGLLIARESASEKTRQFKDDNGNVHKLTLPFVETKVIAREGITLY